MIRNWDYRSSSFNMEKNQTFVLPDISEIRFGLGWDVSSNKSIDLDASAISFDSNGHFVEGFYLNFYFYLFIYLFFFYFCSFYYFFNFIFSSSIIIIIIIIIIITNIMYFYCYFILFYLYFF